MLMDAHSHTAGGTVKARVSGNGRVYYHPLTQYMKCKGSLSERFECNPDFDLQLVLCQVCKLGSEIKQPDRGARSSNEVVELEGRQQVW